MVMYVSKARLCDAQSEQSVFKSITCGNGSANYLLYEGLIHSVGIGNLQIKIPSALTGATNFKLSLYRQQPVDPANPDDYGFKILDNLLSAPETLPTDFKKFVNVSLGDNEYLPMQIVMGELGSNIDVFSSFNLVISFDAAITASNVEVDFFFRKYVFIGGSLPSGKTIDGDYLVKASN